MPRRKYDDSGYGTIVRNYDVKCTKCGKKTRITEELFECEHCQAALCPDCLRPLANNTHKDSGGNSNGSWYEVSCASCGYLIVDI